MPSEQVRKLWDGRFRACQERRVPAAHESGIDHVRKRGNTSETDRQMTETPRTSVDVREGRSWTESSRDQLERSRKDTRGCLYSGPTATHGEIQPEGHTSVHVNVVHSVLGNPLLQILLVTLEVDPNTRVPRALLCCCLPPVDARSRRQP